MNERMDFTRPFPNISFQEYVKIYQKVTELESIHEQYDDLLTKLDNTNHELLLYLHHYRYRLPWMIAKHQKNFQVEKLYSIHRPETDKLVRCEIPEIVDFFKSLINDRLDIIKILAHNEIIISKSEPVLFNNCETALDSFISSLVIPNLFGNFIGQQNVDDFIEAVGRAFDSFAEQPFDFILNFDSSFLCRVLREFFFSPFFREFVGEQFSGFLSFFTFKKSNNDQISCSRFQSFLSLFFSEFSQPLQTAPTFFRKLFQRMAANFNPTHIVATVILNSLIIPMIGFPTVFSALPNYQQFHVENLDTARFLRYYAGIICGLPLPDEFQDFPIIETYDRFDSSIFTNLVEFLMKPIDPEAPWNVPENKTLSMNAAALKKMARLLGKEVPLLDNYSDTHIVLCSQRKSLRTHYLDVKWNFQLIAHAFLKNNPYHHTQLPPSIRGEIALTINESPDEFVAAVESKILKFSESAVDIQEKTETMDRILNATKKEFYGAEANLAVLFVRSIIEDKSFKNEHIKKKNLMMKDGNYFCNFIVSTIENYISKNSWASTMITHIVKYFLAFIMQSFPLQAFADAHPELKVLDQKFAERKENELKNIEKNGYDEKVAKLLKSDRILTPALNAVLSSHLYENPIESSLQIVLAVSTVEDLFTFQYNEPPEGNQLMPLMANLFITSPAPSPLTFSKWLAHFVQPVIKAKPDWFSGDDFHSLEHFFQFNAWMEDVINDNI